MKTDFFHQYYNLDRGNCSPQKTRKSSAQTLLLDGVETWRFLAGWYKKGKLRGLSFRNFDLGLGFFVNDVGSWERGKRIKQCVLSSRNVA